MPKRSSNSTHTILLPQGQAFEIKDTFWEKMLWSYGNPRFSTPLFFWNPTVTQPTQPITQEEKTRGELYHLFAFAFDRDGSKNPETAVAAENRLLLSQYLELGGNPNDVYWDTDTLLIRVLESGDYLTIGLLLDDQHLDVNWPPPPPNHDLKPFDRTTALTPLQAFIKRYEPGSYKGLSCSLIKNAFKKAAFKKTDKSTSDADESVDINLLTAQRELQEIWRRLERKGVNLYQKDLRGMNPLLWATECNSHPIIPLLIAKYTEDERLVEMILSLSEFKTCVLGTMMKEFSPFNKTLENPYLKDFFTSITEQHRELFQQFTESEPFPLILSRLIRDHTHFLEEFDALCTRCNVQIPKNVWMMVINEIAQKPNLRQRKLFTSTILRDIIRKAEDVNIFNLIVSTFDQKHTEKYNFLLVLLTMLQEECSSTQLYELMNTCSEARDWNILCYLIADLNRPDPDTYHPNYFRDQVSSMRAVWKTIIQMSPPDALTHAATMMGVDPIIFSYKKTPIERDGFVLPNAPQPPDTETPGPAEVVLNAQSTHTATSHSSTSSSEIVLKKRYKMDKMPGQYRAKLWRDIESHYSSTNAFSAQKRIPYLENLKRSVEQTTQIPGDTTGSIKAGLTDRLAWIRSKIKIQEDILLMKTAYIEYGDRHPEAPSERILPLIENMLQANDWFCITYKAFKKHIMDSTYKDPNSQLTLEEVLLGIWVGIHDKQYTLPDEVRVELRLRLGISMIEIVHQYQAMKPACASGTHNLLIDAVGKGDRIPGVYAFLVPAERLLTVQSLRATLSIAEHFNALSTAEKINWFKSDEAYNAAVILCVHNLLVFLQFGGNEEFRFFSEDTIQAFREEANCGWETWRKKQISNAPSNEVLITSTLKSLPHTSRLEVLSSLESFSNFIKSAIPGISDSTIDEDCFQRAIQSLQTTARVSHLAHAV